MPDVPDGVTVIVGDCVEAMAAMDAESVDALVTDPPYGLEFMGKDWDRLEAGADVRQPFRGEVSTPDNPYGRTPVRYGYNQPARAMQDWHERWAREAFRVLKPGGYLLAFGGTRTYHRLACAIEDAGFEIRDEIAVWMYGSGFPKSLDVSKAIDKGEGYWRGKAGAVASENGAMSGPNYERTDKGEPMTAAAAAWQGWGTALKPAHEPIVVARKPLAGTVAANVLAHGTGALNIDGCRIGFASNADERESKDKNRHADFGSGARENRVYGADARERGEHGNYDASGRWPANVILVHHDDCVKVGAKRIRPIGATARDETHGKGDILNRGPASHPGYRDEDGLETVEAWECVEGCPVRTLDEQTGQRRSAGVYERKVFGPREGPASIPLEGGAMYDDSGGASRFFYTAKASRAERNAGLDGFAAKKPDEGYRDAAMHERYGDANGSGKAVVHQNHHPTVKPIDLMRWLVRLVTPPGGLVLDPFLGSGTTGIAAHLEGFRFVGVEQDAEYAAIAGARIAFWQEHGEDGLRICAEREQAKAKREAIAATGQTSLLELL